MNEKVFDLKFPFSYKDENGVEITINQLTLHRIKAKHLKHLPKELLEKEEKDTGDIIPILALSADLPSKALDELDLVDLINIVEEAQDFFPESLRTGDK